MEINLANVKWSEENGRYELIIDGVLKAYSQGDNEAEHEIGRFKLVKMAEEKGYTVAIEFAIHSK